MSVRTIYSCDNEYSETNNEGYTHSSYGKRRLESEDPVLDGWCFGLLLNDGCLTIGLMDKSIFEAMPPKGILSDESIFCSVSCCLEWAKRALEAEAFASLHTEDVAKSS